MMAHLWQSLAARVALFLGVLLLVAVVSFYAGVRHESGADPLLAPATETYRSQAMGLAFEYPTTFGEVLEEVHERGECDPAILTDTDRCEHRYIGTMRDGAARWFLSAESRLFALHPLPREGRYEDTLRAAEDIEAYCEKGSPLSCATGENAHGLRYVKVGYSPACNGFETCGDQVFFVTFIETGNDDYPVVAAWYDRSGKTEVPDATIDRIIASLRSLR